MKIYDGRQSIELELLEVLSESLPSTGDRNLKVQVNVQNFSGESNIWIDLNRIQTFLRQIDSLEANRDGEAILISMSPDQFLIKTWFYDGFKHLAIDGHLCAKNSCETKISFSIRPDTSMLKEYVSNFHRLLTL